MHVIEWGVCSWQTVLYTWLNLNRGGEEGIEFWALGAQIHTITQGHVCTHDWSRRRGLSWDTSDTLSIQLTGGRAYRSQISMFWSALDEDHGCGEVKHHGGKIFNFWFVRNSGGIARGYSFDIRFTPWVEIFQGGYSEHSFWRVDILTIFRAWFSFQLARAHWLPNQGSSRPALVSRLKLDRVPLMGIRVEFETERQCLHWSAIEKTKFCSVSIFLFEQDKRRVGFGTKCFFPPDLALTDRAASGRLLICCSSPAKGGWEGSTKMCKKNYKKK